MLIVATLGGHASPGCDEPTEAEAPQRIEVAVEQLAQVPLFHAGGPRRR